MNILSQNLTLRAIEERDLPDLQRWSNDPSIQAMLGGWHFPIAEQDQRKWFESLSFNSRDQRFVIELNGQGLVGTANLVSIDWQNRNAFHGMLIGESRWRGKGLAQEAVRAIMRYAFQELGLHRLESDIIEYNASSLKLYLDRCGWRHEGVRKEWYFRQGRRWDKILIGITAADYQEQSRDSIVE